MWLCLLSSGEIKYRYYSVDLFCLVTLLVYSSPESKKAVECVRSCA